MVARRSFIKLRTILACACSKRSRRSMVRQAHHERLDLPLVLSSSKDALRSSRRSVRSRRSNRSTASLRSKRFRLRQVPSVPKFHLFQSSRSSPATKNQERSRIGGVKRVPTMKIFAADGADKPYGTSSILGFFEAAQSLIIGGCQFV